MIRISWYKVSIQLSKNNHTCTV